MNTYMDGEDITDNEMTELRAQVRKELASRGIPPLTTEKRALFALSYRTSRNSYLAARS